MTFPRRHSAQHLKGLIPDVTQQQFKQATDRGHHRRKEQEPLRCFFPSGLTSFSRPATSTPSALMAGFR